MKIQFNEQKDEWEELPPNSSEGYYVDRNLYLKLLNIFILIAKSWDCVIDIDGMEGSGKSTLGLLIAWILSKGKLTINNVAEGTADAIKKIKNLDKGNVLIIDEGSLLFSSKEVMRREQIQLIKILNVVRQKSLILIIISPSFFDLNKYIAVHRSRFLIHVYTDPKLNRGRFAYFGTKRKKMLYEIGKKNYNSYSKPKSNFRGMFTDFKPPFYDEYLKTKERSLEIALDDTKNLSRAQDNYLTQRNLLLLLFKQKDISLTSISKFMEEKGIDLSISTISKAILSLENRQS